MIVISDTREDIKKDIEETIIEQVIAFQNLGVAIN